MVMIFNNNILALCIHYTVERIQKLYYMPISVYEIYYHYFKKEGNSELGGSKMSSFEAINWIVGVAKKL